jgi:hypothetical protein
MMFVNGPDELREGWGGKGANANNGEKAWSSTLKKHSIFSGLCSPLKILESIANLWRSWGLLVE